MAVKTIRRIDKITRSEFFINFDKMNGGHMLQKEYVFTFLKDESKTFRLVGVAKIDSQVQEGSRVEYPDSYFRKARGQIYAVARKFDGNKRWVQGELFPEHGRN